jgi:hypothetical protein
LIREKAKAQLVGQLSKVQAEKQENLRNNTARQNEILQNQELIQSSFETR